MESKLQQITNYYFNHSLKDTQIEFNMTRFKLLKLLEENNIEIHSGSENQKLHLLHHGNSYKNAMDKKFNDMLNQINPKDFENYYRENGTEKTLIKYNISKTYLKKILNLFSIKPLTMIETKRINYIEKYGSFEEGLKIERQKACEHTDYKAVQEKKSETCLERYGSISPLGNEEIKEKAKQTCIEKYGVDNVFKSSEMQKSIQDAKISKYGGYGWDSEELRNRYNETMLTKYGVEWGCETENCLNSSHGKNSFPNLLFETLLTDNKIEFEREFVIENFRYDFKINDVLIEINPSYTHNSTLPYKNRDILPINYHLNKSITACNNGYHCIHV